VDYIDIGLNPEGEASEMTVFEEGIAAAKESIV
jgi:hypothetical protein